MRPLRLVVSLQVLLFVGCASIPIAGNLSTERARVDAYDAIKSDRISICLAGTRGVYPVGVTEAELPLIASIPKRKLPSGCIEPNAAAAIAYAREYNKIIIMHITSEKQKNG